MKRKIRQISKYLASMLALLMFAGFVYGQQVTVTGNVTSSDDGLPIPGVTILEKGTSNGTTTDVDGNYSITVSSDATLVFSFVGMQTREIPVEGRTNIDVVMSVSVVAMDEVVVTSLGISKEKKSLGYAVSEVSSENISLVKDHNPANSLVGKVAGVVVTQGSGGPGGGSRIIIRGNNSITGNNQPLIVVDGIPIDNSGMNSGGSVYSSTITGGGITDINPDDIESISVLKGPNAAALYGSRAGNGVLLITTKSGAKRQGLGVTVNSNITFDNPMVLPDYQNEYGQGTQGNVPTELDDLKNHTGSWGPRLDGSTKLYFTGEQRPYVAQPDNVKNFFRTAGKYVNTLSLDGGGETYSARFSYTNNMTESMLPNSDLGSHNFNIRANVSLTDKLSVDAKATYFTQQINNRGSQGSEGVLAYVYPMPRNVDIEDLKTYQKPEESINSISYGSLGANPYWILYNDRNEESRDRILGFVKMDYQFTDWLSAFGRIGTDVTSIHRESVNQAGHHFFMSGRLNFSNSMSTETNADFLITANKDIMEDFNVTLMAGGNHSYRTGRSQSIYGEDFKIPTRATVANCVIQRPGYGPLNQHIVNSVYGQFSLAYNDMVYVDVTGRNDWSSTLPEQNRSYFYPSVSASVLLNEILDPAGEMFDLLKVRGSWANVGNDTGPYQIYTYYNVASDGYLGLTQLSRPSIKFNENLKPENINSIEFGIEGRMFLDRIFFDIGLYQIRTTDQIYDVPVPAATGYSYFRENIGETSNKGIEILLGVSPVRTSNFSWDVSLNFSRNVNTLVELTEDLESHVYNTTNSGNLRIQSTVDGGYGDIYGTDFRRTEDGELIVDAQGRFQSTPDKVYLGNSQPDFIGGIQNSIRFMDISLSFLVDARIGGKIYSHTSAALAASGVSTETLEYREEGIVIDGVVRQADDSYIPNTTTISAGDYWGSRSGIASAYIFEQTNVRLREFVLSYNVPSSILANMPVQGASIGLVGRNLFFIYKDIPDVDPEASLGTGNSGQGIISYNLPTARSIGFNINVKF
ncbi:MAG: SusC/RagA family TonB-linked outer membrane protein [Bacteroidota bacterium]